MNARTTLLSHVKLLAINNTLEDRSRFGYGMRRETANMSGMNAGGGSGLLFVCHVSASCIVMKYSGAIISQPNTETAELWIEVETSVVQDWGG